MKVIAFSLSLFRPSVKISKELLRKDAYRQLSFRNFGFGEEHAAPDFSKGTWIGFLVLMEYSWPKRIRIASLRLDKFVYLRRSLNSRALHRERKLPSPPLAYVSLNFEPMPLIAAWLTFFVVSAVLFGAILCVEFLLGTHFMSSFLGMVLEQPKKV